MTYPLYLDDERDPKTPRVWVVVRSYDEFVLVVESRGIPNYVSLDHDLGEGVKTGYDCVKWFVDHCIEKGVVPEAVEVHAHTANPVGRDNMLGYLASWKRSHSNV